MNTLKIILFVGLCINAVGCRGLEGNGSPDGDYGNGWVEQAVPHSDFTIGIPPDWLTSTITMTAVPDPYGIRIQSPVEEEIEYWMSAYVLHEVQDPLSVQERFLEINDITDYEEIIVQGMPGVIGHSSADTQGEVMQIGIVRAEKQLLIVYEFRLPTSLVEESFEWMMNILNTVTIAEEEHYRVAQLAERQALGDSGFSLQRAQTYNFVPRGDVFFIEDLTGDPWAPNLTIEIKEFSSEQRAASWLEGTLEGFEHLQEIQPSPGVTGYVVEPVPVPERGNIKYAYLIAGDAGIKVTLISDVNLPFENASLFDQVVGSIEWQD